MQEINIIAKHWKRLLVLDSCRYDCFKEANFIKGNLLKINSHAENTSQWYKHNFPSKENYTDIVLIKAVPPATGKFLCTFDICAYSNWWEDFNKILSRIEDIVENHKVCQGGNRTIMHILPPHIPWYSYKGRVLLEDIGAFGIGDHGHYKKLEAYGNEGNWKEIKKLYTEEIRYILKLVMESNIRPDAITGDHGEKIGEGNVFGHNTSCPEVNIVPWLDVEY